MSYPEFVRWVEFYKDFPFDDYHRYHRPSALIASRFGGEYAEYIDFLQKPQLPDDVSEVDMSILKAFGVKG